MIGLIDQQKINGKQAKIVIEQIYKTNKPVEDIIKQFNLVQVTDESLIEKIISDIIKNNPDVVSQYSERPERVEKFIIGLLMKETKGQANPIISKEILNKLLSK
jgi:aspartyl-tRNA(Asn)/glutamyl-tRNA(Gln) amidotransferase subunit B